LRYTLSASGRSPAWTEVFVTEALSHVPDPDAPTRGEKCGLIDRKAPGKAPTLTAEQRAALARAVEAGPEPWRDGVVRWRLIDLVQWLWEEFRV
jgi:hypothetical protein